MADNVKDDLFKGRVPAPTVYFFISTRMLKVYHLSICVQVLYKAQNNVCNL